MLSSRPTADPGGPSGRAHSRQVQGDPHIQAKAPAKLCWDGKMERYNCIYLLHPHHHGISVYMIEHHAFCIQLPTGGQFLP